MTLPLLFLSPVLCWAAQALLKTWQEILTSLWAFLACFSSNFLCFFAPIFPDTWNSGTSSASSSSATLHKRQILNHLSKVPWRRLQCCLGKQQQMKRRHTHFRQDPFRWKKEKKITQDCQSHRAAVIRQTHSQVKAEVKISLILWRKAFHKYFLLSTIKRGFSLIHKLC